MQITTFKNNPREEWTVMVRVGQRCEITLNASTEEAAERLAIGMARLEMERQGVGV